MYSVTVVRIENTFVSHMIDIRFTLDIRIYMFQISSYTGISNMKGFLLGHVIFAVMLFCFTFASCLMDIRFVIASPLFHIGHLLHVGLTGVEMCSVNVWRNAIERFKRSKPALHSFRVGWTFILC